MTLMTRINADLIKIIIRENPCNPRHPFYDPFGFPRSGFPLRSNWLVQVEI